MPSGRPISSAACCTAAAASPSAMPGARLKLMRGGGKLALMATASGAVSRSSVTSAASGTCMPPLPGS